MFLCVSPQGLRAQSSRGPICPCEFGFGLLGWSPVKSLVPVLWGCSGFSDWAVMKRLGVGFISCAGLWFVRDGTGSLERSKWTKLLLGAWRQEHKAAMGRIKQWLSLPQRKRVMESAEFDWVVCRTPPAPACTVSSKMPSRQAA